MWYTITMGILIGLAAILVIALLVVGLSLNKDINKSIKANSSQKYMSIDDIRKGHAAELAKKQKAKETKEIIKGAAIGGIVAGDVGAVVGATIAKNNIDNQKK